MKNFRINRFIVAKITKSTGLEEMWPGVIQDENGIALEKGQKTENLQWDSEARSNKQAIPRYRYKKDSKTSLCLLALRRFKCQPSSSKRSRRGAFIQC